MGFLLASGTAAALAMVVYIFEDDITSGAPGRYGHHICFFAHCVGVVGDVFHALLPGADNRRAVDGLS